MVEEKHAAVQDVTAQTPTINCSKDSKLFMQKHEQQNDETQKYGWGSFKFCAGTTHYQATVVSQVSVAH